MNTKLVAGMFFGLLALASVATEPESSETLFAVKPSRCIALREGQPCYQKLQFSWQSEGGDRFCLYESESSEALACWEGIDIYRFNYRFKSAQNKTFYLVNERTEVAVDEVEIVVAWVYKSGKKVSTGWRLF